MKSVRALAIMGDVFFDPLARSEVVPGLMTEAPVVPGSRIEAAGGAVGAEPVGPVDREPELGINVGVALVGGACLVLVSGPIDIRVLSAVCKARE